MNVNSWIVLKSNHC